MAAATPAADVVARIKKVRASGLRVTLADGETRDVTIPGKRKKWSAVENVLAALAWIRIECLDAKKGIIDIIDNDDYDDEVVEGTNGNVAQLTALMLRAQDVALKRNAEQMRQSNELVLKLCTVLMERLVSLEKAFASNLRLAQKFAAAAAEGGDDDGLLSSPLVEALAPHLMLRLLPGVTPDMVQAAQAAAAKPGNSEPTGT